VGKEADPVPRRGMVIASAGEGRVQVDLAMLEPPAWLADEPEITAMLHAVVDRFDLQRGIDRTRDIAFSAAGALPSLATNDARAGGVWSLVQALAELALLKIKRGKRNAFDHDWVNARLAFPSSSEDTLRAWLNRAPAARAIDEWREAVQQHAHRFGGAIELLKFPPHRYTWSYRCRSHRSTCKHRRNLRADYATTTELASFLGEFQTARSARRFDLRIVSELADS